MSEPFNQKLFNHMAAEHGLTLLESEMEEIRRICVEGTDTERLDWIQLQGNGDVWVARQSVTGRGFRLHNTSGNNWTTASPTVREAIDTAMKLARKTQSK